MTINSKADNPFTFDFKDDGTRVELELTNGGDQTLSCVEVLTIFLKDQETLEGSFSQASIKFKDTESVRPKEKIILSHRTWIDGAPAHSNCDQLARLKVVADEVKPYVLNISWKNSEGKARFQRIPIGH